MARKSENFPIKNYSYENFATYSNGDMIIEIISNKYNSIRIFYGIKKM